MTPSPEKLAKREKHRRKAERAEKRVTSRRRAATLVRMLRGAVRWLPMPAACALGHGLGTLAYLFAGRVRRQALANLAAALPDTPERERRRIARRSCALLGRGALAYVVAHRMGRERAMRLVREEGEEHLREALAVGKGVLFVTLHFGCFELLASFMGVRAGAKALARPTDDDGPYALLLEMRREMGCETIGRGQTLDIIRTLRSGKPLAMLIDQDTDDVHGAFVPYFGRLAHTPLGPAALAVRAGAPVVMGFIAWEGLTRHVVYGLPPLYARTDLPTDEAVLELTARMTSVGEAEVRKRPDHWVWFHRRWQTRPEDHPEYAVYEAAKT